MYYDMADKKKEAKRIAGEKKIRQAAKQATKIEVPEELKNKDFQILMPFVISSMRSDFTKVQLDVILSIIEKIGLTLRDIVEQKKNGVQQLKLFAEEELGEDPDKVKLKIPLKEFGVSQNHYPELRSALKAMATVPVQLPIKSASGKEYIKYTNFCAVYIPNDQTRDQYCIVEMDKEVSIRVRTMELGYHYVRKQLSRDLKSKYHERIYWHIESFKEKGVKTLTSKDFRQMLGLVDKYRDFSVLEQRVLIPAQKELERFYKEGNAPCYFTYRKIYEKGRKRGEPEKIEFTIISREPSVDEMLIIQSNKQQEEIKRSLIEDLLLSENLSSRIAKRVTPDNFQNLLGQIINLKVLFDDKEKSKGIESRTNYIVKSLNNFFVEFEKKKKDDVESAVKNESVKGQADWTAMMSEFCKGLDATSVNETISRMSFGGFDPTTTPKKTLTINVPSHDIQQRIENDYREMFLRMLKKHFGEGVAIKFSIPQEKEVANATE